MLVVGGRDESKLVARQMYVFDPSSETFTAFGSIRTSGPFGSVAVTLADGNVLLVATARFSALAAPEGNVRENHSAVKASDGGIWIIGGDDGTHLSALTSVIRFDSASTTSSHALDLATARTLLGAVAVADSRVLVAGGASDLVPNRIEQSSEVIDATTKLRIAGPQMSASRYSFTMTPLSNGKVRILGGLDQDGNPMASAEIYE